MLFHSPLTPRTSRAFLRKRTSKSDALFSLIQTRNFAYRYILDPNSTAVTLFSILIGIIVVPNVLLNLYVMAFGFEDNDDIVTFLQVCEILFALEIIQNFFTAFSDPEHYEVVDSLKLIAQRYIFTGSFPVHALANIPWFLLLPSETEEEKQLQRDLILFKMLRISRLGTSNFIPEE